MTGRALKIALTVSLVVNLFALGAFGGGAWMWTHGGAGGRAHRGRPILAAADALPAPDRQRFHDAIRAVLVAGRPLQRTARENRRAAADAFVQPTFDADAVDADLARAREADFALRVQLEGAVVAFAKTLPTGERAVLAQGLARRGPLRHPRIAPP